LYPPKSGLASAAFNTLVKAVLWEVSKPIIPILFPFSAFVNACNSPARLKLNPVAVATFKNVLRLWYFMSGVKNKKTALLNSLSKEKAEKNQ
jgi:hypothetical protein